MTNMLPYLDKPPSYRDATGFTSISKSHPHIGRPAHQIIQLGSLDTKFHHVRFVEPKLISEDSLESTDLTETADVASSLSCTTADTQTGSDTSHIFGHKVIAEGGLWKRSFAQFARETTLHGLRIYRFKEADPTMFKVRRFMFLLCVGACAGLFCYQASEGMKEYFKYKTNSNMDVKYVKVMEFPSVTICNQNEYRLTETTDQDMYEYVVQFYKNKGSVIIENPMAKPSDIPTNMTKFMIAVAHQKRDLIDDCFWLRSRCDIDKDFKTTLTDMGVCYTFIGTNGKKNPLQVKKSGSGFGLQVKLNIEKYEYMPELLRDEAGVKVLLHAPDEIPLVKDLGFSVAPGTHTLVSIKRTVVNNLEKPYGSCVRQVEPRSVCSTTCDAKAVVEQCGCVDYYMPKSWSNNVEYLSNRYVYAQEVSNRVRNEIKTKDRNLIDDLKKSNESFQSNLTNSYKVLVDEALFEAQYGIDHYLIREGLDIIADLNYLNVDYNTKHKKAKESNHPELTNVPLMVNSLTKYINYGAENIDNNLDSRSTKDRLRYCADIEVASGYRPSSELVRWANYSICKEGYGLGFYTVLRNHLNAAKGFAIKSIPELTNMKTTYENFMFYLLGETSKNYTEDDAFMFVSCSGNLNALNTRITPETEKFIRNCEDYLKDYYNYTNKVVVHDRLNDFFVLTGNNMYWIGSQVVIDCNKWRPNLDVFDTSYQMFRAYTQVVEQSYLDVSGKGVALGNNGVNVLQKTQEILTPIFNLLDKYTARNISKLDLAHQLTTEVCLENFNSLALATAQLVDDYDKLINHVFEIENNLIQTYTNVFDLQLPVMNNNNTALQSIIKYARKFENTDSEIQRNLQMLFTDRKDSFLNIIKILFEKFRLGLIKERTKLEDENGLLESRIENLQQELLAYLKAARIGDRFYIENFIKLEIFYRDMSYDSIRQLVSMDEYGLISRVGSFMGLLLGASALTACELIDLISMNIITKLNRLRKLHKMDRFEVNKSPSMIATATKSIRKRVR